MKCLWNEFTKHDGLIIVKLLSSTIYQFYFMKILLVLFLVIQLSCQLIQIYLFANEFSVPLFIQYSPSFFVMCLPILAAIILLINPKLVENLHDDVKMWPIDNAVESTKQKIKREMKIVSLFTIINTIGAISIGFCVFIFNHYDYTTFLSVKYFTDYYPKYSNILIKIYKASLSFAACTTFIAHAYQVVYYTQHMKYQIMMSNDLIGGLLTPENNDTLCGRLIDDKEYQQLIKSRLIDLVIRHEELLISGRKKIREISNYVAYFSLSGLLSLTSFIYVLATGSFTYYDYRYLGAAGFFGTITATAIVVAGQSVETILEKLYYLLQQIDWYQMNIENRKIYTMILSCAQRKVAIRFSENYSINYNLGLAVVRGIYSIVSVLVSFNSTYLTN